MEYKSQIEELVKENEELKVKLEECDADRKKHWKEKQDELSKRMHYQYAFESMMEYLMKNK